ncbi:hypothetical protein IQ266_19795 [filamentous cyanobacterium LEGE 11480]|uniref:Uncharacterized protein n=1 Tax=Romeriopsis navalis LEGE 11480 TaxID=2777977 RepID=A0A928Z4P9_9CYAN|nr:hypothetical protein [Romeriopsis navalis]MBE9031984.1 hypothetical protein [Romeriopsis navalis LEGE 11480]
MNSLRRIVITYAKIEIGLGLLLILLVVGHSVLTHNQQHTQPATFQNLPTVEQ